MYRVLLVSWLALFGAAIALSDVNKQCIADNSEAWSNDNLIGTWYRVWHFSMFGGMVPTMQCPQLNFTRPTAGIVQQYKDKYNDPGLPYNIDDNPLLVTDGSLLDGMIFGHNIAKFYVLSPNSSMILNWDGYAVDAYRLLTPKYLMYTQCAMRGNFVWLMSTVRDNPIAEMEELIQNTPELKRLQSQRFCASACCS